MSNLVNASYIASASLSDLRNLSTQEISTLPEDSQLKWKEQDSHAKERCCDSRYRIDRLLAEFKAPLGTLLQTLTYEPAFVFDWFDTDKSLYEKRWWVNEYKAGVYFIYDCHDNLRYIGSSCGGKAGGRLWNEKHKEYRCAADIVLFDREWLHLTVAFEVLAITRLKPGANTKLKDLWIIPPPEFRELWPRQAR
jgi:hypothetical protein